MWFIKVQGGGEGGSLTDYMIYGQFLTNNNVQSYRNSDLIYCCKQIAAKYISKLYEETA